MPLTAVVWKDYSHREHVSTIEELLAASESDPMHPIPYAVAASILEEKDRPTEGLSITQLVGKKCLRCQVLQKFTDYAEPIENMFARWRGTITHAALERFLPRGATAEVRFFHNIPDLGLVHGQVDLIMGNGIYDFKTAKEAPRWDKVWENHNEQLQSYRWLVNKSDYCSDPEQHADLKSRRYERVGIYYVTPDYVKPLEVRKSIEVEAKKGGVKKSRVPDVWSDREVEAFLLPRFERLNAAFQQYKETGKLPPYPPGFDIINDFAHRYSPTASQCVRSFVNGN